MDFSTGAAARGNECGAATGCSHCFISCRKGGLRLSAHKRPWWVGSGQREAAGALEAERPAGPGLSLRNIDRPLVCPRRDLASDKVRYIKRATDLLIVNMNGQDLTG